MSRLTNWLLIPPVSSRLSERYRHYRHHGASSLSAALGCFWMILAWMFIPLEHPRWQRIRARHGELYPHINPDKPRPLDPARYAIQSIWLLATSTGAEKKTSRWRSFDRVQNLREHYHQWLNRLPDRVGDRTGHLDNHKEPGTFTRAYGVLFSAWWWCSRSYWRWSVLPSPSTRWHSLPS